MRRSPRPHDSLQKTERQSQVVRALQAHLPAHALIWHAEDTTPYECDGLTAYRQRPLVVALPETEAQVAAVLKTCHQLGVPVVARGAGTGLSGGAMPHTLGVTLSLAKFNRILKIDPVSRTAVVQCGVRNLAISEAAAPFNLYYAPDPSSQIACTIGGNVAENSGGVHCLKYGLTLHNVLRVRGFTAEGEAIEFGGEALDAPGLDLLALVIGSEGMLAVTTEVTVKLVPKPQLARCIMASFDDVRKAGDAVAAVIAAGIIPAGLEMMDKPMTAAVEDFVRAGYDLDAAAILLCESDGTPEEVEEEIGRMTAVLRGCGATAIAVSNSEDERMKFWSGRKNAFPASGRISPDYMCLDSTIPLVERIRAAPPTPRRCASAAAAPRTSTARRRKASCSTPARSPASRATSRASWSSPCAPARRWPNSKPRWPRRAVPALRAAALRRRASHRRRHGRRGLSGPARASVGAVRDYVLGATLVNGRGELLSSAAR
jgi:glycolate oxidase